MLEISPRSKRCHEPSLPRDVLPSYRTWDVKCGVIESKEEHVQVWAGSGKHKELIGGGQRGRYAHLDVEVVLRDVKRTSRGVSGGMGLCWV